MISLKVKAWLGNIFLAVVMSVLLFATSGTVYYWQGWLFLAVFLGAVIVLTAHLAKHDPALLRRRLAGGPLAEPETSQKVIMLLASIGFLTAADESTHKSMKTYGQRTNRACPA
jgi:hypothetical protein